MRTLFILFVFTLSTSVVKATNVAALAELDAISISEGVVTDPPREPRVNYPRVACPDEWTNVCLELIDKEPGVDYCWNIPSQYNSFVIEDGDKVTITDMTDYNEIFPISIIAKNSCGITPVALRIEKVTALNIPDIPLETVCAGDPYMISPFSTPRIVSYDWDFGTGKATGDTTTGEPFTVEFPDEGLQDFSVVITDTDGCTHSKTFQVQVYTAPPSPAIQCTDGIPGMVIFDWVNDDDFTYVLNTDNIPSTLSWTQTSPTQLEVVGFTNPCQFAILGITVTGTNPAPCDIKTESLPCRPSPKPTVVFDHMPAETNFCIGDDPFPVVDLVANVNGTINPADGFWQYQSVPAPQEGYTFNGNTATFSANGLAPGIYPADYIFTNPADNCIEETSTTFVVYDRPQPNARIDEGEICSDTFVTLTFDRYEDIPAPNIFVTSGIGGVDVESTGENTRKISFPNQDLTHEIVIEYLIPDCLPVQETVSVKVNARPDLMLACGVEQSDHIVVNWDSPGGSTEVFLNGNSRGTTNDNTFRIDGLEANRFYDIVIATETLTCGTVRDTVECSTVNCISPIVDLSRLPDTICWNPLDGTYPLDIRIEAPQGSNGDFMWRDPSLVDNLNQFTPDKQVQDYNLIADWEDSNGCREVIEVPFVFLCEPTPFLEADKDTVCVTDVVNIESKYITLFNNGVMYDLDIPAGANLISGSEAGPYEFSFDAPGEYEFGMTLNLFGKCPGATEVVKVVVQSAPDLGLACGMQAEDSVNLEWNDLGLTYEILQDNTPIATETGASYVVPGLAPNSSFEFVLSAIDPFCGMITDTVQCVTFACDAPVVINNIPDTICWNPTDGPFPLDFDIVPAMGAANGDFEWDSPLVDNDNNTFTPDNSVTVNYSLNANYMDEDGCPYTETVEFIFVQSPEIQLGLAIAEDTICINSAPISIVGEFTGQDLDAVEYATDFPAGVNVVGNPQNGTFELIFDAPGDYSLGMAVSYYKCMGEFKYVDIHVNDVPDINLRCGALESDAVNLEYNDLGIPYQLFLDDDYIEEISGTEHRIDGLDMGISYTYIIEAISENCGFISDTVTCLTVDCIEPIVENNIPDTICWNLADGPYALEFNIIEGAGGAPGSFIWDTPLVNDSNEFTPDNPAIVQYSLDAIYTDNDGCPFVETVDFFFVQPPVVELQVVTADTICLGNGTITIQGEFDGLDASAIEYMTDFPAGVTVEDNPSGGEYVLSFARAGEYSLGVAATYYGCEGPASFVDVVITAMPDLGLDCAGSENEAVNLEFFDLGIPYTLYQDGAEIADVTGTEYRVENLAMNDNYQFVIEAMTADCGLVSDTVICTTFSCDPSDIDLSQIPPEVCHDSSTGLYEFLVTVTPADPAIIGSIVWDSPQVNEDGEFSPDAGVEDYNIQGTYVDANGCRENIEFPFTYIETPQPLLTLMSNDTICMDGSTITFMSEYTAPNMSQVTFQPVLPDGANIVSGNGAGPYEISFDMDGTFDLGMMIENSGCASGVETLTVVVEPGIPETPVTTEGDYGAIVLSWEPLDCVSTYKIYINGEFVANVTGLTYTAMGLEGETSYDYIVEPISNCLCDTRVSIGSETTLPCPPVDLFSTDIDTCYNPSLQPFSLSIEVMTSGLITGGEGMWGGDLINNNQEVDISLADEPGTYTMTYTYVEAGCPTSSDLLVTFHAPPTVELEPVSPQCIDDETGMVIVNVEGGAPDFSYALNGGAPQLENVFDMVSIGNFEIEVIDANGCVVSAIDEVVDLEDPTAEIDGLDLVVEGNDATFDLILTELELDRVVNITWFFNGMEVCQGLNCTSWTLVNMTEAGLLEVEIDYGVDCLIFASKELDINEINDVYIPNIVDFSGATPAPDNEWRAYFKGSESFLTSVRVFDRWGNMVEDYENKSMDYFKEFLIWDGFFGSEPAEQGVYTYVIELLIEGKPEIRYGNVTVLR